VCISGSIIFPVRMTDIFYMLRKLARHHRDFARKCLVWFSEPPDPHRTGVVPVLVRMQASDMHPHTTAACPGPLRNQKTHCAAGYPNPRSRWTSTSKRSSVGLSAGMMELVVDSATSCLSRLILCARRKPNDRGLVCDPAPHVRRVQLAIARR